MVIMTSVSFVLTVGEVESLGVRVTCHINGASSPTEMVSNDI